MNARGSLLPDTLPDVRESKSCLRWTRDVLQR
jgi:hypothetical protein